MKELLRIARTPAVSTHPQATVLEVCQLMMKEVVGAVVVLDEGGKLLGIFSERDVVGRVVLPGLDAATTPVAEVMTRKVATARAGMTMDQAVGLMHHGRFRHLPLVNDDTTVVGMISVRHLLRHRVDQLDLRNADLLAYISADGPGG
jgi:CBS domain-containing protein